MDKKEFFYLFKNSLKIIINDDLNSIFYVYNKSIERQIKYNRLFNLNKPIKYTFNKNDIIFKQDLNNNCLWYDYDKIYLKLKENNKYKKIIISNLIKRWLVDDNNWEQYTPDFAFSIDFIALDDETNCKQYTPTKMYVAGTTLLDDETNWKQYTPKNIYFWRLISLNDDTN